MWIDCFRYNSVNQIYHKMALQNFQLADEDSRENELSRFSSDCSAVECSDAALGKESGNKMCDSWARDQIFQHEIHCPSLFPPSKPTFRWVCQALANIWLSSGADNTTDPMESFFSSENRPPITSLTAVAGAEELESDWASSRLLAAGLPRPPRSVRRKEQQKRAERDGFRPGDMAGGAELELAADELEPPPPPPVLAMAAAGGTEPPKGQKGANWGGDPESRSRLADTEDGGED
jgi:hypothetical protein